MIKCDFDLCIYNRDKKCLLRRISVSSVGCCEDCIIPDLPKDVLEMCKKDLLGKFNLIHEEWKS